MNQISDKFVLCRACPQRTKGKPSNIPLGYYYDTIGNQQVLVECKCHKEWREAKELSAKLKKANITPDYTFDDYKGTNSLQDLEALKSIAKKADFFSHKKMVYLWGPNGTQKTSMVQALGKELIKQNYKVQYLLMQDLINTLMPDFSADDEEKKRIAKKLQDNDFLIIDEAFDKTKVTLYNSGFQIPFLDSFLRTYFDTNKGSIIFVSNKKPEEIAQQGFGESLQNFVQRNTRTSLLMFEDKYIENANTIDRLGLFS